MVNESNEEPWGCGFDAWLRSVGSGSNVAMSCGVGRRCGSDPALLQLWHRPAATAPIRPLAWEPPYVAGAAPEKAKNKQTNKNKKRLQNWGSMKLGGLLKIKQHVKWYSWDLNLGSQEPSLLTPIYPSAKAMVYQDFPRPLGTYTPREMLHALKRRRKPQHIIHKKLEI